MEAEAKINLNDLSKIPPKEFEKNFREWLDRDDVARSLQAQLRMDLIKNFNKTVLGRQILSQATSTNKPYGGAAATQRLTLSPMVLALNTLVAEFLYAENCHFSLSVFCTEIPYRNTLPDFESSRYFRFTNYEIYEILEAVSGPGFYEKDVKSKIVREYELNTNASLLLVVLKNMIKEAIRERACKTPEKVTPKTPTPPPKSPVIEEKSNQPQNKPEKASNNLRCINRYLIVLSNKVQYMSRQLQLLTQKKTDTARQPKTPSQNGLKLKSVNRSLEIITANLKKMAIAKIKNKRIDVIVKAIETMSNQFEKCAANFEKIFSENVQCKSPLKKEVSTSMPVKTYTEWLNELRVSQHGQKFLDKVENSLRKALNRQKKFLAQEIETKLHHQKELLKIRYKQKLMKHMPRRDPSVEFNKLNYNVERQLEQFEVKHFEMLQRLHEEEQSVVQNVIPRKITPPANQNKSVGTSISATKQPEPLVITLKSSEPRSQTQTIDASSISKPSISSSVSPSHKNSDKATQPLKSRSKALRAATKSNFNDMIQQIADDERKVDSIVFDAKLRLQELEVESNHLEENFHQYLKRQQKQNQVCREASATMWNNYLLEKNKIESKYQLLREATRNVSTADKSAHILDICREEGSEFRKFINEIHAQKAEATQVEPSKEYMNSSGSIPFGNAILEAKAKLFRTRQAAKYTNATERHVDRRSIYTELKNAKDSVLCVANRYHKSKGVNRNQRGHKRKNPIETYLLTDCKPLQNSYDPESEISGVETNDSYTSSNEESEVKVLLEPPNIASQRSQILTHDMRMMQPQKLQSKPRLKPWTTTETSVPTKSPDHKSMRAHFVGNDVDNVGDYNNKVCGLNAAANKENRWDEDQPTGSKTVQRIKSGTLPATTPTTMVLQQSMAKMNRLFQCEQHRRRLLKKQHKLKEFKQQQQLLQLQEKNAALKHMKKIPIVTIANLKENKFKIDAASMPVTATAAAAGKNNSAAFAGQNNKTVADNAMASAVARQNTIKAAVAAAAAVVATAVDKVENASENQNQKKKTAADQLTETVATLTLWRAARENEIAAAAATTTTTEQWRTKQLAISATTITSTTTGVSQQSAIKGNNNADSIKKVDAVGNQQRKVLKQKSHNQQQQQQQTTDATDEETGKETEKASENEEVQERKNSWAKQQQHEQHHDDFKQQSTSSLKKVSNQQTVIEEIADGASAIADSTSVTTDVSSRLADDDNDDDADADDDDLQPAPPGCSAMSMTSLLALQFSTGFNLHGIDGGGDVGSKNKINQEKLHFGRN